MSQPDTLFHAIKQSDPMPATFLSCYVTVVDAPPRVITTNHGRLHGSKARRDSFPCVVIGNNAQLKCNIISYHPIKDMPRHVSLR